MSLVLALGGVYLLPILRPELATEARRYPKPLYAPSGGGPFSIAPGGGPGGLSRAKSQGPTTAQDAA
jgi:hypothetical protein